MFSWFISLFSLVTMLRNAPEARIYADTMVVVEVDNEWVTCVDFNGNEWAFENEAGDWMVGDFASVTMSNNGTDTIYDDIILSAKYSGWCQGAWGYDAESGQPIVEFY